MWTAWSASRTWRAPRSESEYTATVGMPSSRQARMTRTAISPRFAIRSFTRLIVVGSNVSGTGSTWHRSRRRRLFTRTVPPPALLAGGTSKRDVAVLLRGILVAFGFEPSKGGNELRARFPRMDDFVDEAARSRDVRV